MLPGAGPGYRKLALPGLKSVDFFGLKVISLGQHVFRSVTLSGQKYSPIGPALKALQIEPFLTRNCYGGKPAVENTIQI